MAQSPLAWSALGLGLVFNALANILIKIGAKEGTTIDARSLWDHFTDWTLLAGVASFGVALAFYSFALTRFDLSIAYPIMTSVGLILVFVASVLWLGEAATASKLLGTALILGGVVLLAR